MKTYTLLRRSEIIDNTPSTGHGDFPRVTWKSVMTIGSTSPAKAKAFFKKMFPHVTFTGKFAPYVLQEN